MNLEPMGVHATARGEKYKRVIYAFLAKQDVYPTVKQTCESVRVSESTARKYWTMYKEEHALA